MMYENTRKGIIAEFTDKLCDEARSGSGFGGSEELEANRKRMQEHFINGLVCDLVDRVAEDPASFQYIPSAQEKDKETYAEMDGAGAMDESVEDLYR